MTNLIEQRRSIPQTPESRISGSLKGLSEAKDVIDTQITINGNALGELTKQFDAMGSRAFLDTHVQLFNDRVENIFGFHTPSEPLSNPFLLTPLAVNWIAHTTSAPGAIHGLIVPGTKELGDSFAVFLIGSTMGKETSPINPLNSTTLLIPDPRRYERDAQALEKLFTHFQTGAQAGNLLELQAIDKEIQRMFYRNSSHEITFNGFHQHTWGNVLVDDFVENTQEGTPIGYTQADVRIKEAFASFIDRRVNAVQEQILG